MVSQLLVASGIAAACGFLGVNEWLRGRALRIRSEHTRRPYESSAARPSMLDRVTPREVLIGPRQTGHDRNG